MDSGRALISRVRFRALLWTLAIAGATFAAIALTSLSWVPVVGAAIAAAVVSVNKVAARLDRPLCWHCGTNLSGTAPGAYGKICPTCGSLNQHGSPHANAQAPVHSDHDDRDVHTG